MKGRGDQRLHLKVYISQESGVTQAAVADTQSREALRREETNRICSSATPVEIMPRPKAKAAVAYTSKGEVQMKGKTTSASALITDATTAQAAVAETSARATQAASAAASVIDVSDE